MEKKCRCLGEHRWYRITLKLMAKYRASQKENEALKERLSVYQKRLSLFTRIVGEMKKAIIGD